MRLYHCTRADKAQEIVLAGFRGGQVWDHKGVVFCSDRPLRGFGEDPMFGRGEAVVIVEADEALLALDEYTENEREWDNQQYSCRCYCLPAGAVNRYPRRLYNEEEP